MKRVKIDSKRPKMTRSLKMAKPLNQNHLDQFWIKLCKKSNQTFKCKAHNRRKYACVSYLWVVYIFRLKASIKNFTGWLNQLVNRLVMRTLIWRTLATNSIFVIRKDFILFVYQLNFQNDFELFENHQSIRNDFVIFECQKNCSNRF